MSKFEFALGPMVMKSTSGGLMIQAGKGWKQAHPHALDVHLTLPLVGEVPAHVTVVTGSRKHDRWRDDLKGESFTPAGVFQWMRQMQEDLALHWISHLERADLEALTNENFVAFPVCPDIAAKYLTRFISLKPLRVRFSDLSLFKQLSLEMFLECATLPIHLPCTPSPQPIMALQLLDEGVGRQIWLTYLEAAPPILGASPGWYWVPRDLISPELVARTIARRTGDQFFSELRRISFHFGARPLAT